MIAPLLAPPRLNPANVSGSVVLAGHGAAVPLPGDAAVRLIPAGRSEPPSGVRAAQGTARRTPPPWDPAKVSHRRCAAVSGARVPLSLPSTAP